MDKPEEQTPSKLAKGPQEGGEIRSRWEWVEPTVWTERMLAALETGIEGGKWFRLIDKVWGEKNLARAFEKVMENGGSAGIDRQSVREFARHREKEIEGLERELREQNYRPRPVKRVWIGKLGSKEKRPLGIPAVRDRIVQGALRHVIEPIFERNFAPQSFRIPAINRIAHQAIAAVYANFKRCSATYFGIWQDVCFRGDFCGWRWHIIRLSNP
jgi:retron-type reverse transcriptase